MKTRKLKILSVLFALLMFVGCAFTVGAVNESDADDVYLETAKTEYNAAKIQVNTLKNTVEYYEELLSIIREALSEFENGIDIETVVEQIEQSGLEGEEVEQIIVLFSHFTAVGTAEEVEAYLEPQLQTLEIKLTQAKQDLATAEKQLEEKEKALIKLSSDVKNLEATQTSSSITLKWTVKNKVTGYRIYYKVGNAWKKCVNATTKMMHTFSKLPSGTKYTFAVRAYTLVSGKAEWDDGYSTISTATQPLAPSTVTCTQNTSAIKLSWTASKGATGYRIYYYAGGKWNVAVKATAKNTHTFKNLKPGSKYTFAVKPFIVVDNVVVWGGHTTYKSATVPAAPTVKAASNTSAVTIAWNAVKGADGYRVYYKTSPNGVWKIKTSATAQTKLTYKNLPSGKTYYIAVRAYLKLDTKVLWSSFNTVTIATKTAAQVQSESLVKTYVNAINALKGEKTFKVEKSKTSDVTILEVKPSSDNTVTYIANSIINSNKENFEPKSYSFAKGYDSTNKVYSENVLPPEQTKVKFDMSAVEKVEKKTYADGSYIIVIRFKSEKQTVTTGAPLMSNYCWYINPAAIIIPSPGVILNDFTAKYANVAIAARFNSKGQLVEMKHRVPFVAYSNMKVILSNAEITSKGTITEHYKFTY